MNSPFNFFMWIFNFEPIKKEPMELWDKYKTLLDFNGINTVLRKAHFFGQMKQESGLKPIAESLNYATDALIKLFGRHRISIEDALKYGRNKNHKADQEALANILYGGNWGQINLGNIKDGDGWKYRGRGFKQITGRSNYTQLANDKGIDVINNPDLLLEESNAMISAIWFWNKRNLSALADQNDYRGITKSINGGYNGLDERIKYTDVFKVIIK